MKEHWRLQISSRGGLAGTSKRKVKRLININAGHAGLPEKANYGNQKTNKLGTCGHTELPACLWFTSHFEVCVHAMYFCNCEFTNDDLNTIVLGVALDPLGAVKFAMPFSSRVTTNA